MNDVQVTIEGRSAWISMVLNKNNHLGFTDLGSLLYFLHQVDLYGTDYMRCFGELGVETLINMLGFDMPAELEYYRYGWTDVEKWNGMEIRPLMDIKDGLTGFVITYEAELLEQSAT